MLESMFEWLFGSSWNLVVIQQEVIENLREFAKANHPREFSAFLGGEIQNKKLIVTRLLYQEFHSDQNSAIIKQNLPLLSGMIGTVHSHSSPNNSPSLTDLRGFSKHGQVHGILAYPYDEKSFALYDSRGKKVNFIVDSGKQ